jgi:hypothetical protein
LLEGRTVNLRVVEKADLPIIQRWDNDPRFINYRGELDQASLAELTRRIENEKRRLRLGGRFVLVCVQL